MSYLHIEAIGTETLEDLVGQREQLLRAADTVKETDDEVSKAKRILISMGKRYTFHCIVHPQTFSKIVLFF
jgi:hypothetical protein